MLRPGNDTSLPDAVDLGPRADQHPVADDGRRGHRHVVEAVDPLTTTLSRYTVNRYTWSGRGDSLRDLRSPPGNRLEALKGGLAGLYSIRINDQWRVVFRWTNTGPADVDICDDHGGGTR